MWYERTLRYTFFQLKHSSAKIAIIEIGTWTKMEQNLRPTGNKLGLAVNTVPDWSSWACWVGLWNHFYCIHLVMRCNQLFCRSDSDWKIFASGCPDTEPQRRQGAEEEKNQSSTQRIPCLRSKPAHSVAQAKMHCSSRQVSTKHTVKNKAR